jgi:hypothetical protein
VPPQPSVRRTDECDRVLELDGVPSPRGIEHGGFGIAEYPGFIAAARAALKEAVSRHIPGDQVGLVATQRT